MKLSPETQTMFKSWAKTAGAAAIAVYLSGNRDIVQLLNAALVGVLPVVYAYLDPKDARYGKKIVVKQVAKAPAKKAVAKKK